MTKDPVEKRICGMQGHDKVRHFGVRRELDKGYGWNEILNRTPMYGKQSLLWQISMQIGGLVAVLVAKFASKLFIFFSSKLKRRISACFYASAWYATCTSAGSEGSSSIKLYLYTYGHQNFLDSRSRKQPTKTYHLTTFGDYEVHLVIMNYLAFNFVICTLVLVASFSF